jgi:hypothetical protein
VAEIALADNTPLRVELGHAVRAVPRAVLTPDAGVRAVQHDAGRRVFLEGIDRATAHTGRLDAVIAAHREIRAMGLRVKAALDLADAPPVDGGGVGVLLVAGDDTALAADALAHIEVKSILLAAPRRTQRHVGGWLRCGCRARGREHECDAILGGAFEQWQ